MRRHAASHPEVVGLQLDLLWSINDVLRGGQGIDLPRLGLEWINDLYGIAGIEAERAASQGQSPASLEEI
jgi:hypothetical protein